MRLLLLSLILLPAICRSEVENIRFDDIIELQAMVNGLGGGKIFYVSEVREKCSCVASKACTDEVTVSAGLEEKPQTYFFVKLDDQWARNPYDLIRLKSQQEYDNMLSEFRRTMDGAQRDILRQMLWDLRKQLAYAHQRCIEERTELLRGQPFDWQPKLEVTN